MLSRAQGAQLRTGARELSAAAAHLVREAQRAADAGEESAADAQAAASAAAAAAREVLMQVAVRLEAAVGDACVPPIALTAGDAAAEAAERQLWRALKLVELIGAWRDQLADGALRELAAALLAQHALALPPRPARRRAAALGARGGGCGGRRARAARRVARRVVAEGVGRRRAPRCWAVRCRRARAGGRRGRRRRAGGRAERGAVGRAP